MEEASAGRAINTNGLGTPVDGGPANTAELISSNRAAEVSSEVGKKIATLTRETQMQRGKAIYWMTCFACHQTDGQGISNQVPPLAKSDFLLTRTKDSIHVVLMGCSGEITVNGKTYKSTMLPQYHLSDEHIANVLNYVRNSWGNSGEAVTAGEVARIRREAGPPPASGVLE